MGHPNGASDVPDPLPVETVSLSTRRVGGRLLVFDEVASTNDLAARSANGPSDDGLTVLARRQTAGRGQYGRTWASRPGDSLLVSVALYPPPEVRRPVVLTALAAVAVADTVQSLTGVVPKVKWPNDVLAHGKKVCGILIEQPANGPNPPVIVGIGLNLNQTDADFLATGLPTATSLFALCGSPFEPTAVAQVLLTRLDEEYTRLLSGDRMPLEAAWVRRLGLTGQSVRADLHDSTSVTGRAQVVGFGGVGLETDGGPIVLRPETIRNLTPV